MDLQKLNLLAYEVISHAGVVSLPINTNKLLSWYDIVPEKFSETEQEYRSVLDDKAILLKSPTYRSLLYDDSVKYTDYLLIRKFAKHIAKHIIKNENTTDMEILTLLIMSPPAVLGSLGIYDVREISKLCLVPPHKVHQYYDIYGQLYADPNIKLLDLHMQFIREYKRKNKMYFPKTRSIIQGLKKLLNEEKNTLVYVKTGETVYHGPLCPEIIDKIDIDVIDLYTAKKNNYTQYPVCFESEK